MDARAHRPGHHREVRPSITPSGVGGPKSMAAWVTVAAGMALRAALAGWPTMWGWGLDSLRFLDPVSGWVLWALGGLALTPSIGRQLSTMLERLASLGNPLMRRALLALSVASIVLIFDDRVWFLGDARLRGGAILTR